MTPVRAGPVPRTAPRRALIVVGKAPLPGRAKTRLVPPLTADEAAALAGAFLLDSLQLGLSLGWQRLTIIHPRTDGPALRALVPSGVTLLGQSGDGLRDALRTAVATTLADGIDQVVVIGSDNPTLPRDALCQAAAALATHDLVIGPTTDGGYYLIGMSRPHLGVFDDIEWSTARVYQQTLAQARRHGIRHASITKWYDVDEPADLVRLRHELATAPPTVAAHTRAVLDRLAASAAAARIREPS